MGMGHLGLPELSQKIFRVTWTTYNRELRESPGPDMRKGRDFAWPGEGLWGPLGSRR